MIKILIFISLLPFVNALPQRLFESIFNPDGLNESQFFGYHVILNDTLIFISSVHDDSLGTSAGALYFYRKINNKWQYVKKILASNPRSYAYFGTPYFCGKDLFIGSNGRNTVYVYEYSNNDWIERQKLVHDSTFFNGLGCSKVRYGNELFVGAFYYSRILEGAGAVLVYNKIGGKWVEKQKIYSSVVKKFASFGEKVEYNSKYNHLFIGAPQDSNKAGRFAGNVYILHKIDSLWVIKQVLSPDTSDAFPFFGYSIATKGDYLFIGACGSGSTQGSGSVYVYKNNNGWWEFLKKIPSPINLKRAYFGRSISIYGDSLLIGAPGERYYGVRISRAYLYSQSGDNFNLEYIFEPSDTNYIYSDGFGIGVCMNKGEYLIGAYLIRKAFLYTPYPVSVSDNVVLSTHYKLYQNYPNPFNPSTKISWQSPVSGHTTLKVYDVMGREVATLVDEFRQSGSYEIEFPNVETGHAPSLPSGVYFYRLQVGDYIETKKMILLK